MNDAKKCVRFNFCSVIKRFVSDMECNRLCSLNGEAYGRYQSCIKVYYNYLDGFRLYLRGILPFYEIKPYELIIQGEEKKGAIRLCNRYILYDPDYKEVVFATRDDITKIRKIPFLSSYYLYELLIYYVRDFLSNNLFLDGCHNIHVMSDVFCNGDYITGTDYLEKIEEVLGYG